LERERPGDLERHLRRVDSVVLAVDEPYADSGDRRAHELAVEHRLLDALVDGRPEPLRDHAADNLVLELVAGSVGKRLDDDLRVAELPPAAGLLPLTAPPPSLP